MTIEQLFATNAEWAKAVMNRRAEKRGWPKQLCDGIDQAALVGLWDAAQKYDSGRSQSFRGYAYKRIYGAVLDFLREQSWTYPRSERRPEEIDQSLINKHDFAIEKLEQSEFCRMLIESIQNTRIRTCLNLYYIEGIEMHAIAAVMGLPETRIRQLVKAGIEQLKRPRTVFRLHTDALEPHLQMGDWVRAKTVKLYSLTLGDCVQIRLRGHTNAHLAVVKMAAPDGEFWVFGTPGQQERVYACEIAEISRIERVAQ
jgi:RNA polymerase sigma factor (sigma-70 family)